MTRSDGMSIGRPSSTGGWPVANTTAPGLTSPADVATAVIRLPLITTPVAATPVATAGRVADSRATARSGLSRACE